MTHGQYCPIARKNKTKNKQKTNKQTNKKKTHTIYGRRRSNKIVLSAIVHVAILTGHNKTSEFVCPYAMSQSRAKVILLRGTSALVDESQQ